MTKLEILKEVEKRIKFYSEISNDNDVRVTKFNVYQHPDFKDTFLIEIAYKMREGNELKFYDEIEVFTAEGEWIAISNNMSSLQQSEFIKDCKLASFNLSNITIK